MFIYSKIIRKTRKHQNRLYLNFWRPVYFMLDENGHLIFFSEHSPNGNSVYAHVYVYEKTKRASF